MAKGKKKTSKKWTAYAISGQSLVRKLTHCPKCGTGIFLANHKTRLSCGSCHYTEFVKKKS